MRTYLLSFLAGLLFVNATEAQTTWTGAIDQNWHNAANWSNGLPAPGNDAFIPEVVNDPVISESTTFTYTVMLNGTLYAQAKTEIHSELSIFEDGLIVVGDTLSCSGMFNNYGVIEYSNFSWFIQIEEQGTFANHGTILGTWPGILINYGHATNEATGVIHTSDFDYHGIHNENIFVNNGTIDGIGIDNHGQMTNNGLIDVEGAWNCEMFTNNGTFIIQSGISSFCLGEVGYFVNSQCGYFLKQPQPGGAIIDLNYGIVVGLGDGVIIIENNGIYSTTFIPDIPIISCFDTLAYLDSDGLVSVSDEMLYEYYDCGDTIVLMSDPDLDCSDLNEQIEIQIGYLEAGEPTYLCSALVMVLDTVSPLIDPLSPVFGVILCNDPLPVHPPILIEDNCSGNLTIIEEILPYEELPCEGYFITYTWEVMDDQGNVAIASSDLEVLEDDLGPDLICTDTIEILVVMQPVVLSGQDLLISAEDNCTEVTVPSQSFSFDLNDVGTHSILVSAIDECGNMSICTTIVIVQTGIDTIAPVLNCFVDTTVAFSDSNCFGIFTPTVSATDNSGEVEIMLLDSTVYHPDNLYQPGEYIFTYVALDPSGNTDTCTTTLIVIDTIPPYLIDSLGVFYLIGPGGDCALTIELIAPLAADNCGFTDFIFFYEFFPSPASLVPGDTFTIIYSTEDEFGNEASFVHTGVVPLDLFPVTIVDCPGDVELEQTPLCPVGLYWNEPLVINTCNIVSVSSTYSPGDTLLPGTYIASYEYLDGLGALHICTFELVVVEQDTVFEEVTLCEDDVVVLPWDGSTVSEAGMYCFTDSICGTTTCLNVILIPSIYTEIDTVHCPGDSLSMPPGTYTYTFLSSLGCDSIVTLNVSFCTAVTSPFGNQEVKVYPNPIHELITLECNRWEGLLVNYALISIEGKPILTGTFEGVKAVIQMPRSINGVVILKIFDGRQSVFQKLVVMPE